MTDIHFSQLMHKAFNEHIVKYFNYDEETFSHYTSVDGFISIIQNSEIWFSNINDVNDITEFDYGLDEIIAPCIKNFKFNDRTLNRKLLDLLSEVKNKNFSFPYPDRIKYCKASIFLFCCSKKCSSTPLWNIYCKNQNKEGISITFKAQELFNSLINKAQDDPNCPSTRYSHFLFSGKVIYQAEEQKKIINDYLSCLEYNLETCDNEELKKHKLHIFVEKLFVMTLFMKSDDYEKEDEIRFVIVADDEGVNVDTLNSKRNARLIFRNSGGFVSSKIAFKYDMNVIKGINISPFMKQDNINITTKYFLSKYGLSDVTVSQTKPNMR